MRKPWLYIATQDDARAADLSLSTCWWVLPTLPMVLVLPFLLKRAAAFFPALALSVLVMLPGYALAAALPGRCGLDVKAQVPEAV